MAFSENLRRIRLAAFLSQAELARRSGVHALTVTRLESGRTAPSTRTVRALAAALGVAPAELATPRKLLRPTAFTDSLVLRKRARSRACSSDATSILPKA